MVRKVDIAVAFIFGILIAVPLSMQFAGAWTGTQNTLSDGYMEVQNVNASNYFLDDTDITDRLTGDWGSTNIETTGMVTGADLNFTSEIYWNSLNRTDTLAYPEQAASYIIFKSGSTYYMKNGSTGQIDYSDTDFDNVISNAEGNLSSGGGISLTAGTFDYDIITITTNDISIVGEGKLGATTLRPSSTSSIITLGQQNDKIWAIQLKNIFIDGRTGGFGLRLYNPNDCVLENIRLEDFTTGINIWSNQTSAYNLFFDVTTTRCNTSLHVNGTSGFNANTFIKYRARGTTPIPSGWIGWIIEQGDTIKAFNPCISDYDTALIFNSSADTNSIFGLRVENVNNSLIIESNNNHFEGGSITSVSETELTDTGSGNTYIGLKGLDRSDNAEYGYITIPFARATDGATHATTGIEIDAAGEDVSTSFIVPDDCLKIVAVKIFAKSNLVAPAGMRVKRYIYGGAHNESYTLHTASATGDVSETVNFGVDDIIYWASTESAAGLATFQPGDAVTILMVHTTADSGNNATDCNFMSVLIQYEK